MINNVPPSGGANRSALPSLPTPGLWIQEGAHLKTREPQQKAIAQAKECLWFSSQALRIKTKMSKPRPICLM